MAIRVTYYFFQNESQSHIIINIRRYQIETLDLKIRTNFHNSYSIWVSDCIKIMIKRSFLSNNSNCSLFFVTNSSKTEETYFDGNISMIFAHKTFGSDSSGIIFMTCSTWLFGNM